MNRVENVVAALQKPELQLAVADSPSVSQIIGQLFVCIKDKSYKTGVHMQSTRRIKRHETHCRLRFGIYSPMCLAFTEDISARGLLIKTAKITPVGTRILIDLTMPNNEKVSFEGIVRWAKSVPAHLHNIVHKGGMGVEITKFISGETIYQKYVNDLHARCSVTAPTYEQSKTLEVHSRRTTKP